MENFNLHKVKVIINIKILYVNSRCWLSLRKHIDYFYYINIKSRHDGIDCNIFAIHQNLQL